MIATDLGPGSCPGRASAAPVGLLAFNAYSGYTFRIDSPSTNRGIGSDAGEGKGTHMLVSNHWEVLR